MADFLANLLDRAFDRATVIEPQRTPLFASAPRQAIPVFEDDRFGSPSVFDDVERTDMPARFESPHQPGIPPAPSTRRRPQPDHATPLHTATEQIGRLAQTDSINNPLGDDAYLPHTAPATAQVRVMADLHLSDTESTQNTLLAAHSLETIRIIERAPTAATSQLDEDALLMRLRARLPEWPTNNTATHNGKSVNDDDSTPATDPLARLAPNTAPTSVTLATVSTTTEHVADEQAPLRDHASALRAWLKPQIQPVLATSPQTAQPFAAQPMAEPAPVSEPTVHISIGRIEIRAATQPLPVTATPRVPRQPSLTLDDYLKQRHRAGGH